MSTSDCDLDLGQSNKITKPDLLFNPTNFEFDPDEEGELNETSFNEFVCELIRKQIENEMKIKHDISAFNSRIITYIYEKLDRGHNQVFDYKFKDYLISIGYDKNNANQAINFLEDSLDGSLDLVELKTFFNYFTTTNWNFKANMHLKKLLNSCLQPGFLDSFLNNNQNSNHDLQWQKSFKFLLSHRLSSDMINEPYLDNKITVFNLRRKILYEIEKNLQEENNKNKSICVDNQCFSNIRVCCSKEKAQALIDGKSHTFWQSTSTEKCENHWILINLKENIKLTQLILSSNGNKNDDFLKSVVIEVRVGSSSNKIETVISKCDYNLTLNNDYLLCSCFPTDQPLNYLKIVFKRNTEKNFWGKNSDQIKIKSLKLIGKKDAKVPVKISVQDASICWYFEMLSALTLIQTQIMPSLHSKLLEISKNALKNIPPLSLTFEAQKTFLTPHVLERVDNFFKNFLEILSNPDEKCEAIIIYLSFNLARGHLKSILDSLFVILETYEQNYNFTDLIKQIDEASQISLKKAAQPIIVKVLHIEESLNDNHLTSTSNDETSEFSIEPYAILKNEKSSISYNMMLAIDKNTTITNMNFKLKLESIGIKGIVIILIYDKEHTNLENYEKFNDFDQEKYQKHKEKINNDQKSQNNKDYEICYFDFYDNQIEVHLELPVFHMVKFILLKFIKSKDNNQNGNSNSPKPINITNFKTYGCKHDEFKLYEELKKTQKEQTLKNDNLVLDNSNKTTILVNRVLWFLCQLAEQNKSQNANDEDQSKFLNLQEFDITNLWKIYDKAQEIDAKNQNTTSFNLRIPILILLYQLVNSNEITNVENFRTNLNKEKSYQNIFEKLCEIIDRNDVSVSSSSTSVNSNHKNILRTITREILKNGLLVFFPSENERKDYFMHMVENSTKTSFQKTSTNLIFEAFCNLFCSKKNNLIQNLLKTTPNSNIFESDKDCAKVVGLIDKIIKMGFFFYNYETESNSSESCQQDGLLNALYELLNSIQSHLFFNIKQLLNKINSNKICGSNVMIIESNINNFLSTYTKLLLGKCNEIIDIVLVNRFLIEKLKNFLNKIIFNYVLWLTELFNQLESKTCTSLVEILINFYRLFIKIEDSIDKNDLSSSEKEKILKTWTFNSKSRSTITDISIQYSYPLANKFIVEFDPNSSLPSSESGTDSNTYLFVDSNERNHVFSGKIDSPTWKEKLEIKSNTWLTFTIHSNKDLKSNTSFFLKFTVTAIGFENLKNKITHKDLIESMACLFGLHFSRLYSENLLKNFNIMGETEESNDKNNTNFKLNETNKTITNLNSDFYRILLRGGYNILNQHLYNLENTDSDKIYSQESENDNDKKLLNLLNNISNYYTLANNINVNSTQKEIDDLKNVRNFLYLYDKNFETNEQAINSAKTKLGGFQMSELVLKIFAILVWHCPAFKYENIIENQRNQILVDALRAAESTRLFIMEQIQHNKAKCKEDKKPLIETLIEKVDFLLKFNRLSENLIQYETKKSNQLLEDYFLRENQVQSIKKSQDNSRNTQYDQIDSSITNKTSTTTKKKNRFPKNDTYHSFNIVFEFVFDKKINDLDLINQIINTKRSYSILLAKNFDLIKSFFQVIFSNNNINNNKTKMELILLFLANLFTSPSNSMGQFSTVYNAKNKQLNSIKSGSLSCPSTLYFNKIHYLQDLYGCGQDVENNLRESYYTFLNTILDYSNKLDSNDENNNRLNICLQSFLISFFDIDWDIFDLKYFNDLNLISYLFKNVCKSFPIEYYKDKNFATTSQVLEDFFSLSKDKFNEAIVLSESRDKNSTIAGQPCFKTNRLASIIEEPLNKSDNENQNTKTTLENNKNETDEDLDSFDMKIYPKLYQSVFQTLSGGKNFDTESLIKCLSADIKSFEQYEKFIVARYMFWKYFSRLKTNFYCNSCDIVLNGNRYVCLECFDHCLCLSCFSKSIISDESSTGNETNSSSNNNKKTFNKLNATTHKSSHKMLLLDHICDQCNSLIIGKRISCEKCEDYDLCLMCSKDFHPPSNLDPANTHKRDKQKHTKDHKTVLNQPVIMVARSDDITDAQVYLYLHSQSLFSILTLKLTNFLSTHNSANNDLYYKYAKTLFSNSFNLLLFMISKIPNKKSVENQLFMDQLKCYSSFSQEFLIGLLASAIKISGALLSSFLNDLKDECFNLDQILSIKKNDDLDLNKLIKFLFELLSNTQYQFDESVYIMLINILKSLLLESDPEKTNHISENIINLDDKFKNLNINDNSEKQSSLELILNFIDKFMQLNQLSIAVSYFSILYELNEKSAWKPYVTKFFTKIFDEILCSIEKNDHINESKLFNLIYSINCTSTLISSGIWIEYKNESRYDGAGVLKSNLDFKLGVTKLINSDSYPNTFFLNVVDPESRRTFCLKSKKYGIEFRRPSIEDKKYSINTKIQLFEMNEPIIDKAIQILKFLFLNLSSNTEDLELNKAQTNQSNLTSRQLQINYEIMHINRKKEFNKYFQNMNLKNSLLLTCLITLIRDYLLTNNDDNKINLEDDSNLISSSLLDNEFLSLISKLSFLNTNLNPNWKLIHLRQFLTSLLLEKGFDNLNLISENKNQAKESIDCSIKESFQENVESGTCLKNVKSQRTLRSKSSSSSLKNSIFTIDPTAISVKKNKDREQSIDDLKLNLNSNAVLGVCDTYYSSSFLNLDDQFLNNPNNLNEDNSKEKKYKHSLKLLDDCMQKLIKYQSSSNSLKQVQQQQNESTCNKYQLTKQANQTLGKFNVAAKQPIIDPFLNVIKMVSNAITVLTCRELLILSINFTLKCQNKIERNNFRLNELNCSTEFEFLQLLEILFHTDNSNRYKLFIKNLINLLMFNNQESANREREKFLVNIVIMACDFMLPEYKQVEKISWSSENSHSSDSDSIKIRPINETFVEDSIQFPIYQNYYVQPCKQKQTCNQQLQNEIINGSNLSAKPNDIEKLSKNNESSNLLVLFDTNKHKNNQNINHLLNNFKLRRHRIKKLIRNSNHKQENSHNNRYLVNDEFESKKEDLIQDIDDDDNDSLDSLKDFIISKNNQKLNDKDRLLNRRKKFDSDSSISSSGDSNSSNHEEESDYENKIAKASSNNKKEKKINHSKKPSILFQVISSKKKEENDDFETEENEENDDDDDDNTDDSGDTDEDDEDDHSRNSDECSDQENNDNSSSESSVSLLKIRGLDDLNDSDNDHYSDNDWYNTNNENLSSNFNNEEEKSKTKKSNFKLPLESIENSPYLAIINNKVLKWKFNRRSESDWTADACSFKIFNSISKNFDSAFYFLDEIIEKFTFNDNLDKDVFDLINDLWLNLIKICCVQAFGKRLKIISLLIKIMTKIESNQMSKFCLNLNKLKPLKSLHYSLESAHRDDRNLSRALFELFFFAEKLAIKWNVQREFVAHMKDKEELIEQLCEASCLINLINGYLNGEVEENVKLNDSKSKFDDVKKQNTMSKKSNHQVKQDDDQNENYEGYGEFEGFDVDLDNHENYNSKDENESNESTSEDDEEETNNDKERYEEDNKW